MEYLLTAREMRQCDENTIKEIGIPEEVLMERAAVSVASEILRRFVGTGSVLVLAGTGNNGGDGLAVARILAENGVPVSFFMTGKPKKGSLNEKQLHILKQLHIPELSSLPDRAPEIVVDAIFGTGLSRDIEGELMSLIETVNRWQTFRVAVDIPSGISADHGKILGVAFRADLTVTFAFRKIGQILYPGAEYCGELVLSRIGIMELSFPQVKPKVRCLKREDLKLLPKRKADSHKGDFGRVLVIAGSRNMCGASFFSAKAALEAGCGLVEIYAPEDNRIILQSQLPEAVLTTYKSEKPDEKALLAAIHRADAVLIGPGLSLGPSAERILKVTLSAASQPLVMDADAITLLSQDTSVLKRPHTDIVLTPHIGEMCRLTGDAPMYLKEEKIRIAADFANEYNVIVALKDSRTVTAVPYGAVYLNESGNHGMATGGSGDVLAGILTGLIATGLAPETAAPLAVYLHGLSGDAAAGKKGSRSLLASDLLDCFCDILSSAERKEIPD